MKIKKVNIDGAFARFDEMWKPHVVAELNGQMVKIARLEGEFIWHAHEDEDELFLVLEGVLTIELRGREPVVLNQGELVVIPKGVEHKPVARGEVRLMLFEPATTVNTGGVESERTSRNLKRLD